MSLEPPISSLVLLVGSDALAVEALRPAAEVLESFGLGSATLVSNLDGLPSLPDGPCAIIVASSDAALPAALAARTGLAVIRIPNEHGGDKGIALLNDGHGQLPAGPVDGVFATMAIGQAGTKNAALFIVATLALGDERLRMAWAEFRARSNGYRFAAPTIDVRRLIAAVR